MQLVTLRSPDSIPVRNMNLKVAKKIPTLAIVGTRVGVEGGFWLRGRAVQRRVLIPCPYGNITRKFTAGKQGKWRTALFL
jgi:hypothetical protein